MALTVGMLALVSCNKDKDNKTVFTANIETPAQGRTAINPENGQVTWTSGDQIAINATGNVFTLQSGANTTEGTFAGTASPDAPYTAVYPASADITFGGSTVGITLPAEQTLTQTGTFANGANPMLAYGTDENLQFKNLCGGLGIRLAGDEVHVSGIRITATGGEKLNGLFEVADCTASEPVLEVASGNEGTNTVTLNCDATLTSTATQEFFIVLPVGALAQGFTMEVMDGEEVIAEKTLAGNLAQVERNEVKCLNVIEITAGGGNVIPEGAINGLFTINANGDQVYFSQGNLQYIGRAATPYWKFAENQWDYLGTTTNQNSSNQTVDRDLFGWGTSGYDHGANCYQPWNISVESSDYWVYGQSNYNLNDQTGQADWGYNAISNGGNTENSGWRTLTHAEWFYVFNTRTPESGIRFAKAQVNNINGVILLPDDWTASIYALNNPNGGNYTSNTITATNWTNTLEAHGAVFLPAAGYRGGISVSDVGGYGDYWSASYNGVGTAWNMYFNDSNLNTGSYSYRDYGQSVRLVRSAE